MSYKKYICPYCKKELSQIWYDENNSKCNGIRTKCKNCGKIVNVVIKLDKVIDKLTN